VPEILQVAKDAGFEARAVAFETITLKEQLRIIADTDVLLGMHGNALIWQQFMRPGSVLVELTHKFYQPYAKLWGHTYLHSSLRNNPVYKKQGEYVPFAHNETEIAELLVQARAGLDRTTCFAPGVVAPTLPNDKLETMYSECVPQC
jgi:capsular polysaccharide biosynthesis protein